MTPPVDVAEDEDAERAAATRHALTDKLLADGMIRSPVVEAAFRAVPREKFTPQGTPLDVAYNAEDSVATKRDENGLILSSISAPFIQAQMIEQAEIRPGMSVLEVGSGGYNAALLAEVVGESGSVTSVDIDEEVAARAGALLEATGYGGRVTVVLADAEHGAAEHAPFDRIIVTVGAWDIPPVWLEQLAADGLIVVPLRMNGITRSIAFRREGDHLVSTSVEVCGFVPIQGDGAHPERVFLLPDGQGRNIKLRFDDGAPDDPSLLDGVMATERTAVWSGITVRRMESFADLHLWFASYLTGFCKIAVDDGVALADGGQRWFPFGVVRGDSFAYLCLRPAQEGSVEFGAGAYGPHGAPAATAMVEQIQAWNGHARRGPAPHFAVWPIGTDRDRLPAGAAVLEKTHNLVTISWPSAD
jgi:protein-L-isoaspartate(D-aspartate) O-methyltransferase